MLWSFRDLDLTLGSLSHYARDLDVTLKPKKKTVNMPFDVDSVGENRKIAVVEVLRRARYCHRCDIPLFVWQKDRRVDLR